MAKMRVYFTTDVHGSEVCFKKFVNAGKFYKANVAILGGDITGKAIIPIMEKPDGTFHCKFLGESLRVKKGKELDDLMQRIKAIGYYPYPTSPSETEELSQNHEKLEAVFLELTKESVRRWVEIAEERLRNTGIKCYVSPGNDDSYSIDPILTESEYVINPDGKIVTINGDIEMISLGNANITPWNCPRDIPEEKLFQKIDNLASQLKNTEKSIFNIHVPPYGSGIDSAPELDQELRPKLEPGGSFKMISVGSKAVHETILKYQPLLGLHGHIHESKGFIKLGRTLCLNPGSEYQEGILRGVLVQLSDGKIKDFMFVSG
ncbi:metallophosphoesterase [Candidatus Bathyarchaeota archaeon]|nr:metallophosphoesterase [Candidatus Bathyarchaeota archaeon]